MSAVSAMRVRALCLSLCLGLCLSLTGQGYLSAFGGFDRIEEGDLLFVAQSEDNAITLVTRGVENRAIDHVAIAHRIGGTAGPLYAIEAIPGPGVTLTPIDSLLCRERDATIVVGRVAGLDARGSVRAALRYVGRAYDDLFLPGDSAVYCSELVQLCYRDTAGRAIFEPIGMTFCDATGSVPRHWTAFYASRGMAVPEGVPGTNPGELSRRPQVTIIDWQIKR